MIHRTFRLSRYLAIALLACTFGARLANASSALITGSYEVLQKTEVGPQTKVRLRVHLTNLSQETLQVQQLLLFDFGHPPSNGTPAPPLILRPGASADTSQEFVVPRLQFEQWNMGTNPRVVLQLQTSTGARITQAIRLEPASTGKGQ
jgi:hypothetical protein